MNRIGLCEYSQSLTLIYDTFLQKNVLMIPTQGLGKASWSLAK